MAKKLTADMLGDAIKDILDGYANEVSANLGDITKEVTKKGVAALKTESRNTFGQVAKRRKKYANTWTSRTETGRISAQGVIYNTQAGLPHLLEHGHVSRNGTGRSYGQVAGREHIAKVENQLIENFQRELQNRL